MQELLNKHMIGTFVIEIAALTVALSIIGFIGMRLRAKKTGRAHSIRQYLLTASFALFLASILSLTLTPIGSANSVTNPELYYPRFYVGWSWQQAWDLTAGMGLRRHMSGQGASHLHDHAGVVGEVLIGILDEAMERGLIAQQNTLGAVHLIHATLQGQRLPQDPEHRESALTLVETFILRGLGASEENVRHVTTADLPSGE